MIRSLFFTIFPHQIWFVQFNILCIGQPIWGHRVWVEGGGTDIHVRPPTAISLIDRCFNCWDITLPFRLLRYYSPLPPAWSPCPSQLTVIEFNHCSLFLLRFQQYHLVARELLKLLWGWTCFFLLVCTILAKKNVLQNLISKFFDGSMTAWSCQYTSDTTDVIN